MSAKTNRDTESAIDEAVEAIEESESTDSELNGLQLDQQDSLAVENGSTEVVRTKRHRRRKRLLILLSAILLLGAVVAAVPFLRYGLVGVFVHKSVALTVVDDGNGKPVSGATVALGRAQATTDKTGVARFSNVGVGDYYASAGKKYYRSWSGSLLVPIFSQIKDATIKIKPIGRSVNVTVRHSVTGKPLGDAVVTIGDASALSDAQGVASVIVGVGSNATIGVVKVANYAEKTFAVNAQAIDDQSMEVKIAPEGRVYYLSKETGVINLMSANLDGSDAKVAVAATGKENDQDTMMMASTDWKYVVLGANREGRTRLYLFNTADNSLTKIDDDDASYQMIGWSGSSFAYVAQRSRLIWQPGQHAIKTYAAESRKLTMVDENQAGGTSYYNNYMQYLTTPVIVGGRMIYGRSWGASNAADLTDKKTQLISATMAGAKRILKEFDSATYGINQTRQYAPNGIYINVYSGIDSKGTVYDINGDSVTQSTMDEAALNVANLPVRLVSPSTIKTAWHELRDGKYRIFTGDANGRTPRQLSPIGYRVYGWYTDNYLLLTKNGSELYIYPADGSVSEPVKITDYHKPTNEWMGGAYGAAA